MEKEVSLQALPTCLWREVWPSQFLGVVLSQEWGWARLLIFPLNNFDVALLGVKRKSDEENKEPNSNIDNKTEQQKKN